MLHANDFKREINEIIKEYTSRHVLAFLASSSFKLEYQFYLGSLLN